MGSYLVWSGCNSFARVSNVPLCIHYLQYHSLDVQHVRKSNEFWPEMATVVWVRRREAPKNLKRAPELSECARESPAGA